MIKTSVTSNTTPVPLIKTPSTIKPKIIFFGNGPLADYALPILEKSCDIIFHARTKEDLEQVKNIIQSQPGQNHSQISQSGQTSQASQIPTTPVYGVLASYGVIIKQDILDLFEPTGILNIHPSLLPKYRGPSPIETAILNGDTTFGVSVMKLVAAMDAGPIYYQKSFDFSLATSKDEIYRALSEAAATWIAKALEQTIVSKAAPDTKSSAHSKATSDVIPSLADLFAPVTQNDSQATYTKKLDKSLSPLDPSAKSATELLNQIRAFSGFPKSKYIFFGLDCTIISAHVATPEETALISTAPGKTNSVNTLSIQCHDDSILIIDQIQPAGRKIMDAKSFLNGYAK